MQLFGRRKRDEVAHMREPQGNMPQALIRGPGIDAEPVGLGALIEAQDILMEYKRGKVNLEKRIQECERWWKLRHWEIAEASGGPSGNPNDPQPKSAWLFNVIMGKQADAIEAYPEPFVLPREQLDKEEASRLTSILPVVMEQNDFEETYSANAWTKNISGTAVYGVFWDRGKMHGLGDISIRKVSPLNLFWQPGIDDIQESPHLFHVELVDIDKLEAQYPELEGKVKAEGRITLAEFAYDDYVSKDKKVPVTDWYYKVKRQGRDILHYVKFVGEHVLFSTENDPEMRETGWYDDGMYPFVFDKLFPVEGSPCGYGYVDIGKSPQMSIDLINQQLIKSAIISATPRYFFSNAAKVNKEQFADVTQAFVEVAGTLDEYGLKPIEAPKPSAGAANIREQLIEEMKYTSANMDVQNGAGGGGITAASAIAALQESAGRSSKAATKASYRAYARLVTMVIERIRQFYEMPRQFRIIGAKGEEEFLMYSNERLQPQTIGEAFGEQMGVRLPMFDLDIKPQKQTAYTRLAQNELAIQLYGMGVFNPAMADQALMLLDMMDFKGVEELKQKVQMNQMMMGMMMPPGMPPGPLPGPRTDEEGAPREHGRVTNARAQAQQSTQPS